MHSFLFDVRYSQFEKELAAQEAAAAANKAAEQKAAVEEAAKVV